MEETFLSILEWTIYGLLYAGVIVLIAKLIVWVEMRKIKAKREDDKDMVKYIKPMMVYMRVKGVDDFVFDCKRWQKREHITIEARAMLKERYKALGDLGANGERDSAWKAIKDLPIIQEMEE